MIEQAPTASVSRSPNGRLSAVWIVPVLASVIAVVLLLQWISERGPEVTIMFDDAQGLTTDAPVMYRGAIVGRVQSVQLNADASSIVVTARLHATAQELAREGSIWWIVRPKVSLEGITGLDTIISPRYLTLSPGSGEPSLSFNGISASTVSKEQMNGIGFTLITDSIIGVTTGTPLYYRGISVGSVGSIQFAPNATAVLIDIVVHHEFSNLVRTNTKFWIVSGIDLDIGLTGISLHVGSITSLLKGGIQLATPTNPGEVAPAGYGFTLEEKLDEDWLTWTPELPLKRDLGTK